MVLLSTKANSKGWFAIFAYCLFISLSAVWVSTDFTKISGSALTFFTLLLAQVIFLAISLIRKENPVHFMKKNITSVFWLNITTLTSWLFMFMALIRIEASVESAIYQGWIPVVVMLIGTFYSSEKNTQKLGPALIFFSIFALAIARLYINIDSNIETYHRTIEGIILASIAGATGGINVYLSGSLKNVEGVSTMNILATRFIVILVVTAFISRHQLINIITTDLPSLLKLTSLSLLFVVIPVFCLQYAILELGALRVSILTPMVPVIALATEYVVSPWHNLWIPILIVTVSLSLIISNTRMSKNKPTS